MRTEALAARLSEARSIAPWLLASVGALALIGVVAGLSAAPPGAALETLALRCLHLGLGLVAFGMGFATPVERMRQLAPGLLVLAFLVLAAMLVAESLGHRSHSAVRWIRIGSFTLQPSTFLQCFWPIALASWAARDPLRLTRRRDLTRIMAALGILSLPVLLQPDLGSVLILLGVTGMTLLFAGTPARFLRALIPVAVLCLAGAAILFDHVGARLAWWREAPFQVRAAREALAAGGLLGAGPGEGVLKLGHVPEGETDFILALIGEEWGLFGTLTLWSLFVTFTLLGVRMAQLAERRYGAILMAAATLMISIQAALNMAVVTGAVPPKGLPLPFVSRGGSSILALSLLLGAAMRAALDRRRSNLTVQEWIPWIESSARASSPSSSSS